MNRVGVAAVAVGSLLALSGAPGAAASPIAQASASAVTLTVAGQTRDTGSYQAVNDGNKETTSGTNRPPVTLLGGQSLLTTGTLAQDASTSVEDGQGHSAACAGLAGPGATVASAGDAGSCLTPGQAVTLNAGNLDLSNLQIVSSGLFMGVDQQLSTQLNGALTPLTSALQDALKQALGPDGLGLAVNVSLGAVQSNCVAGPNSASGSARLAGAGASVTVGGQQVNLVNLPTDPAPNTHVVTNLGGVADAIESALSAQLKTVISNQLPDSALTPLINQILQGAQQAGLTPDAVRQAVLNNSLNQISSQLAPLQTNVIDATLNLQSRVSADQITVTALDLKVLPVVQAQSGVNAFDLQVGTSSCGPSNREAVEAASASATPTPKVKATHKAKPVSREVPTSIPSGVANASGPTGEGRDWGLLALGGLAAIGVGAGGAAWSASRSPR